MNLFARACLLTSIAIVPFACGSDDSGTDSSAQEAGASCGNGVLEGTEECDGTDLGGADCESATMVPGSTGPLACAVDCTFDAKDCSAPSTANGGSSSGGTGGTVPAMGGTSMGGMMGGGGMPSGGSTGDASAGAAGSGGSDASDSGTSDGG